jgi:hypothetical protein
MEGLILEYNGQTVGRCFSTICFTSKALFKQIGNELCRIINETIF